MKLKRRFASLSGSHRTINGLLKNLFQPIVIIAAFSGCLRAQTMIFDSGLLSGADLRVGWTDDNQRFIGDDFVIGAPGEVWIIDKIRTWAAADAKADSSPGDLLERITLFGGLAGDPNPNRGADCACHDTVPLKIADLSIKSTGNSDIQFSQDQVLKLWQIDFNHVQWSVPGGVKLQFGVSAAGRPTSNQGSFYKWFNHASAIQGKHSLRVFSESGKLESFLEIKGKNPEQSPTISIQVWGHLANK